MGGAVAELPAWPVALPALALAADEVHVWLAELTLPTARLAALAATLTTDERDRAMRFRFPAHRDRFIAGRGLLRELLGAYLDRPAAALGFSQGAHGKPALVGAEAAAGLCFNLSHSGDRALLAVAYRELGVDMECMDRTVIYTAIIERVCTPRELMLFQAQPSERTQEIFFTCWTRKEAIAKALGGGLASGLRTLEVCFQDELQPDGRIRLQDAQGREWRVLDLPLDTGWAGALAVAGADWRWRGWRWGSR
ncbi:MAG: 4'-phosphopantetheinyl transferase superfamily protein [Candidatus Competibacteraceae bacterium]